MFQKLLSSFSKKSPNLDKIFKSQPLSMNFLSTLKNSINKNPNQFSFIMEELMHHRINIHKSINYLTFLHFYVQNSSLLYHEEQFILQFLKFMVTGLQSLIEKQKKKNTEEKLKTSKRISKSAVLDESILTEIETYQSKDIIFIENLLIPYIGYLQKLVTSFTFYRKISQTSKLNEQSIWKIMNTMAYISRITDHILCLKIIAGRSFKQYSQPLCELLCKDIKEFYQKVSRYVSEQSKQYQDLYFDVINEKGEKQLYSCQELSGTLVVKNLLDSLKKINLSFQTFFKSISFPAKHLQYEPTYVNSVDKLFEFIFYYDKEKYIFERKNRQILLKSQEYKCCEQSQIQEEQLENQKAEKNIFCAFRSIDTNNCEMQYTFRNKQEHKEMPRRRSITKIA